MPCNPSYIFLLISLMHKINAISQQFCIKGYHVVKLRNGNIIELVCYQHTTQNFCKLYECFNKMKNVRMVLLIFLLPSAFIKITTWQRILTCNIYSTATLLWNVIYNVLCKLHCKRTDVYTIYTKTIIICGFHNHKWYNMKAFRKKTLSSNLT